MEQGTTFRARSPRYPTENPDYRILAKTRSRFTHYYFYLRDETLGPMVLRVASFFPFQTTYYLNRHSFIERELLGQGIDFRKNDNAFLGVSCPEALQAAADRLDSKTIRKRLEYWTLVLGPKFSRRERREMDLGRFYAIAQVEYCRNFIFKNRFPIRKIFERSCEIGLWRMTARKISEVFGIRITKKLRGKLQTTLDRIDHGHHVFRAYFKNAFLKQYEKFSAFLRNELCSNNLADFRLKKGLDHLDDVRRRFQEITDRFAGFQAQWLNLHADFSLLERLARPICKGSVRIAGIKLHDTRMIRLMEILLDTGTRISGWSSRQIHQALLARFRISEPSYSLGQLRYDLRKLRAHGLLERDRRRYVYALTEKGTRTALLFLLFHKRVFGPLAHSQFVRRPNLAHGPDSKLERAYQRADKAIDEIVQLVRAA
jgi:DNA-binding PadR family transcriptional regulator